VKNPQKINKIKKHDVPDLYRSHHRIRFYLEFCLQFRQHGNVSIIKMWSLNDNMIERLYREIELEIESLMTFRILLL
jgi:hypothetical protein